MKQMLHSPRAAKSSWYKPSFDVLESRTLLSTLYALTNGDTLLRFDSAAPATIQDSISVTGMQPGEDLLGIDFRPATGQLYALGSTSRLYTINLDSGAATAVNSTPFTTALSGTRFGFDFNPAVDRIRVVSDAEQNLRINPNTGSVLVDGNLNPGNPNVIGSAYSNNFSGTATTTLFGIDTASDNLVRQTPPNDGTLVVVGPLNVDVSADIGLDIVGGAGGGTAGTAFAALTQAGVSGLYTINLASGAATPVGNIGNGSQAIDGLAALPDGFRFLAAGAGGGKVQISARPSGSFIIEFTAYTGIQSDIYVAVGDLTRDGIPELVTATGSGVALVKVFDGADFANTTFDPSNPDASLITQFFAYSSNLVIGATIAVGDVTGDLINDLVTGAASGNPVVKVFDGADIADGTFDSDNPDASTSFQFFAYGINFNVGTTVAVGDLDRDGFRELVTGALPGNPHVKVYDGAAFAPGGTFDNAFPDASLIEDFFAYGINFNIGAHVSVADTNGDGFLDLITGASGGNPHVRIFDGDDFRTGTFDPLGVSSELTNFFAFELNNNVGVRVGGVDFDRDGIGEVLTGSAGGAARYRVFRGSSAGVNPPALLDVTLTNFSGNVAVGG